MCAIFFYFVPGLGLLNVLAHWKFAKVPFEENLFSGDFEIEDYKLLTKFSIKIYYWAFLFGLGLHFVIILILKMTSTYFSKDLRYR